MKFDDQKDVAKNYGILRIIKFTELLILKLLNFKEIFELEFVLKDEIRVVIFLKDEIWAVIFERFWLTPRYKMLTTCLTALIFGSGIYCH